VAPDAAAGALRELADLHLRLADPGRRAAEAPWVQPAGPGSDYAVGMLRYGIEHHRDRLRDAFVELAELYCERRHELQALWHAGPHTVVHGDPHLGNVFDDHGRTGFLDWGIVMLSTPMRDVSYFLTMAMDVEDRRRHEADLLREYLDAAGRPMAFDEAWRAHRVQAAYTVPASCQVVTFPEGASAARRIFADAFLDRSMAAVEDLESAAAVREAWA
jgi:aminoglycoside phosphotransferase (APT) family kinase protein